MGGITTALLARLRREAEATGWRGWLGAGRGLVGWAEGCGVVAAGCPTMPPAGRREDGSRGEKSGSAGKGC